MIVNIKCEESFLSKIVYCYKSFFISIISSVLDLLVTNQSKLSEKNLIFIAGIEGSGTTLLNKILSEPINSISITHHDYIKAEIVNIPNEIVCMSNDSLSRLKNFRYFLTVKKFNFLVNKIWEFPYKIDKNNKCKILKQLRNLKIPEPMLNIVIKRSYPSGELGVIFPNLSDLFEISKNVKIIHIERNFEENCASILRRGFVNSKEDTIKRLKRARVILKSQITSLKNANILSITYDDLVKKKLYTLSTIENFLGYKKGELTRLVPWIGEGSPQSKRILENNFRYIKEKS